MCRVKAVGEIGENGGFTGVAWSKIGRRYLDGKIIRRRIRLPIIVHGDQVSVSIPKFKDRIQQGIGDTEIRQRGTERTHHYRGLNPTLRAYNETTNHDIRLRPDKATCAEISQLAGGPWIVQVIEFDQRHTGAAVIATDNGRIKSGFQCHDNGGLEAIRRIEIMVDERLLICLRIVRPVPIGRDDGLVGVM